MLMLPTIKIKTCRVYVYVLASQIHLKVSKILRICHKKLCDCGPRAVLFNPTEFSAHLLISFDLLCVCHSSLKFANSQFQEYVKVRANEYFEPIIFSE